MGCYAYTSRSSDNIIVIVAVLITNTLLITQAVSEYDYSDYDNKKFENETDLSWLEEDSQSVTTEMPVKCSPLLTQTSSLVKSLNLLSLHLGTAASQVDGVLKSFKEGMTLDDAMKLRQTEFWEQWGDGENSLLCNNSVIDTIFAMGPDTFVFRGNLYWKLSNDGVVYGYPRQIQCAWRELPSNIDGAFTARDSYITYFFKGKRVWAYKGFKLVEDYPKFIRNVFRGIPDDIDDVVVWSGNGRPYFFKGDKCWRYHTNAYRVKGGYSIQLNVSDWRGVPNNIDAGFSYTDGLTYFFKNDEYYRYDDVYDAVARVNPSYPRLSSFYWFGCRTGSLNSEK